MGYGKYSYEDYEEVVKLWRRGLSKYTISKLTGIPPSTIYNWVTGRSKPPKSRWRPPEKPDPTFTYILGVLLGDATVTTGGKYKYKIKLKAWDREFVERFSRYLSTILNKKYRKPMRTEETLYIVEYYSKAFYDWFKNTSLNDLKDYVEHCRECKKAFLRGLFDSEGSHSANKAIYFYNTDRELIDYTCKLLSEFGIIFKGPYITIKAGDKIRAPKKKWTKSEYITAKKDLWTIQISGRYARKFLREIGFSIRRKQLGLKKKFFE